MTRQNGIIRAVSYVLNRVLTLFPVWTITTTDGTPIVIRAPIPIFGSRSVLHSAQIFINSLRVRREVD